jgi:hypothetical protein
MEHKRQLIEKIEDLSWQIADLKNERAKLEKELQTYPNYQSKIVKICTRDRITV